MNMKKIVFLMAALLSCVALTSFAADKKIVLVAGHPSHGPGEHEFNAGCLLLKKCLDKTPGVQASVYLNGWPKDEHAFDGADAVVFFMDGGPGHPIIQEDHLKIIGALMKKGVGLACMHYGVEVPKDKGGPEFMEWIGGYYESAYSTNPHWEANFNNLPAHPIMRGVKPFKATDEWYYNIRFRPDTNSVTALLVGKPSDETRQGASSSPRGPYPHIVAASGRSEILSWCVERPDGGRGFGFTGGHSHTNWGNEDFRRFVLNALLWTAKAEVPANGVQSTVTAEELAANLDPKPARKKPAAATPPTSSAKPLYRSGVIHSGLVKMDVDLAGAKDLYLVVNDGGDGIGCDWADWVEPQLVKTDGTTIKLTDLTWKNAASGHGEVGINKNAEGRPLKIGGKPVSNGIGVHAVSIIHYSLPEGVSRFQSSAGNDNGGTDQGCGSTVEFLVFTQPPGEAYTKTSAADGSTHKSGPEAAQQDVSKFTVADGLEVSLFASEPMIVNPADMDIDAKGRVWITEGANYRKWATPPLRAEGDRIVILEDTKGTGTADKATTFYQDLSINTALGIGVFGNKVIVSCAPNVFVLTDTDGDGIADKRELLFTGISGEQHDHAIHTFTFGPDGKLYFNFGNAGRQLRRPTGKLKDLPLHGVISAEDIKNNSEPVIDLDGNEVSDKGKPYRQGMVFRCNVDGSEVETLAWNFRNNYEVAVDSFGTLWQSDNDDDGNKGVRINYVMEYGNYGYTDEMTGAGWQAKRTNLEEDIPHRHWHQNDPGVVPNLVFTGAGSPTGICVYEGKLLPEIFRNQVIHCDAGPRIVRSYPVVPSGAGYEAKTVDILTTKDSWFRPSDVCVSIDGSLYVADWNDAGVGGHNMADRELTNMTGRVYRVAPKGSKPMAPKLDLSNAASAVAALESPNLATRYLAWTALHEMQGKAEKELLKLWKGDDQRLRARALHLLARIKGSEQKYVELALKDKNSDLRIAGLRLARELKFDVIPYVKQLVKDSSAQVRRDCAIALRHNTSPEAATLWAELAAQHDGKDRWYVEALGIGADKQETVFFGAWLKLAGDQWNTAAGRDIVWRSRGTNVPAYLVKILEDKNTPENEKPRYLRAMDFIPKCAEKDAALAELALNALK